MSSSWLPRMKPQADRGVAVVQVGDFGHGFLDRRTAADSGDFFREHAVLLLKLNRRAAR